MTEAETWRDEARRIFRDGVRLDEPLDRHASMGVGGPADALFLPADLEELTRVVRFLRGRSLTGMPVGNWTNLFATDRGYRGALISLSNLRGITTSVDAAGEVTIHAGAGAGLGELVDLCRKEGWAGLEFCAGIPGSVGGAVRMNAGAYGGEIKNVVRSIRLLGADGTLQERPADQLFFEYRNLTLPEGAIIVEATFGLRKGDRQKIAAEITGILANRRGKHPLNARSAGSVFKNPKGGPAGRLIEDAGLKGLRIGDAQVSELHANFIVNLGHARASDVIALIDAVRTAVLERTGIALEREVKIIGERS
ncbi:MAG: UDP-N-acetylenolpyruvoylglucosamine reductase [Syntrophaceae bacterium PtaU1.Bin231]|nr:MAG: UDP-N-acetylenolpyruvoylglucosamine reductase [Syntrophaceae bacterium PtaU1.Bin231]